jgi:acyl-CoA synthetase (AMP-forming)/AMP-acid ligase II
MTTNSFKTVAALLRAGDPTAPAIGAPDRKTMTRGELSRLVEKTGGALRAFGIQQDHAVAMVMPNGPEMAAAFLAVTSWATAAPLNPAYRTDEFNFYLDDLQAKALIIEGGPDSPARAVAAQRNIPVIELTPDESGPAGSFTLSIPFADAGFTPRAPHRGPRSCRCASATSRPRRATSRAPWH